MIYQNYHKHTMYSNVRVPDSVASYEQYATKANEYGHGLLSSVEHGWQGRYIEAFEVAKKHNLKFLFGTETYFVLDRKLKDPTNAHMILLAKNENGRKAINRVLSEANMTGFYYQPRIDFELLLSLPKDDVWVTSACLAGILRYTLDRFEKISAEIPELATCYDFLEEPYEFIAKTIHDHFGDNFFIEVQSHHTERQLAANRLLLPLAKNLGIKLIAGVDSHYVSDDLSWERDEYLASRGMHYEDEDGWFMDYPDGDTFFQRFKEQGLLSDQDIADAINQTNIFLTVEEYDSDVFKQNIKMPILPMYSGLSQEERNQVFIDLIYEKWGKEKENIPPERLQEYEKEIAKEIQTVIDINHADYFLLDYNVVNLAAQKGGVLTSTSRGSSPSFYLNKLLGLTSIDALSSPVLLYPERFLSKTRILESKSLADIDLNCANVLPFWEAQEELLGKGHSYPMITFGTYKVKSAWKLFAKSQDIAFETTNAVSAQLDNYLEDLKNAEEDEKEELDAADYIEDRFKDIFEKSKVYRDIVASISIHPCSVCPTNLDILSEIGLMQINDNLCCILDGKWAEEYKFLKNDFLTVSVVDFIKKTYERVGVPRHTTKELLALCTPDHPCWNIYKNGWTVGINQCEQSGSRHKVAVYKPKNISELSAFVAAIRPGFKSMYDIFEKRQNFEYGIPAIDNLIRTPQFPQSYMLYQEQAMKLLNYSGIPMDETYDIIKAIAKKRPEKVLKYRETFLAGVAEKIQEDGITSAKEAKETAERIWQIISDSQRYSFNACLAGNTVIVSGDDHISLTIEDMYQIRNIPEYAHFAEQDMLHIEYVQCGYGHGLSLSEKRNIVKNQIIDIKYSGFKQTFRLTTAKGFSVVCTGNHKIPTLFGEKQLSDISVGEFVYVALPAFLKLQMDAVSSIEPMGEQDVFDIEMADPNHNLAVNGGLVVSNSHSLSVALDSLYGAYLKSTYPLEFYETYLRVMEENSKKDKMLAAQQEATTAFNIRFLPLRFGQDNRQIVCHPENNTITASIQSLKGFSKKISYALYMMKDYTFDTFIDLLYFMKEKTPLNVGHISVLIALNYFEAFGGNLKLKKIFDAFNVLYDPLRKTRDLSAKIIQESGVDQDIVSRVALEVSTKEREYYFYYSGKGEYEKVEGESLPNSSGIALFQTKMEDGWHVYDVDTGTALLTSKNKVKKKEFDELLSEDDFKKTLSKIKGNKTRGHESPRLSMSPETLKFVETKYLDIDIYKLLVEAERCAKNEILGLGEQVLSEKQYLSYISTYYEFLPKVYCYVEEVDLKYKPRIDLYTLGSGKKIEVRVKQADYNKCKIVPGDFIKVLPSAIKKTQVWNPPDEKGNFTPKVGAFELTMYEYTKIDAEKMEKIVETYQNPRKEEKNAAEDETDFRD